MPTTVIAGTQWGDEGKGKITDWLAPKFDIVVRCQGGSNAGHTIHNQYGKVILNTVPSGIFNPNAISIIGDNTVVNPVALVAEIEKLHSIPDVQLGRLVISANAHLVLPYHLLFDELDEKRRGDGAIGSTKQGIAWAYADKALRRGLTADLLCSPKVLKARLQENLPWVNKQLGLYGYRPLGLRRIWEGLASACEALGPYVQDTTGIIRHAELKGAKILLEGQLGAMRDLTRGAYPYVTSSCVLPADLIAAAGVNVMGVKRVIGITKAFTSAVGAGPMPTRLTPEVANILREAGGEYGAKTGRARDMGWLDLASLEFALDRCCFTEIIVTKLDSLDGLFVGEEGTGLKICMSYRLPDNRIVSAPTSAKQLDAAVPVYNQYAGWEAPAAGIRERNLLPRETICYMLAIENRLCTPKNVPISFVTNGQGRDDIIEWSRPRLYY